LYRLPLGEFVAARTALARTLTGDAAKRVKALTKPTVVPWAINQTYWHARRIYDRAIAAGERLRKAQVAALEGKKADVRSAADAHRQALADVVRQATAFATAEGAKPDADALFRTFEALSMASEKSAAAEAAGRLTRAPQPAGFEALMGVKVKEARPAAPATKVPLKPDTTSESDRAAKEAAALAARQKQEAEIAEAEAELEKARARLARLKSQV
jgi:hypothetical protein